MTATALGAAGALPGGASANLWTMPHGGGNAPPAQCSRADTTCKAGGPTPAQSMGLARSSSATSRSATFTQAAPGANSTTSTSLTAAPLR